MQKKGLDNGHGRQGLTRRQLLGQGLALGAGMALLSPLSLLFGRTARAAPTPAPGGPSSRMPFLAIDLAGGGNIAGSNVMVGKSGQLDFLASYDLLGLPAEMHPSRPGQIDTSMGLAFHADSAFLRGIKSIASASTLANVDGFVVPGFSLDDSRDNQQNPCHWIYSWGRRGTLAQLVGSASGSSGGNTLVPEASLIPSLRAISVTGRDSALNIAAVGTMQYDVYSSRGSNARAARVLKATGQMNETILSRIPQADLAQAYRENIRQSYGALGTALTVKKEDLDPAVDPNITSIYPAITNAAPGDEGALVVSITKLLLDGYAGCGAISLRGFDYHTANRSVGELADFRAGRAMGLALEIAAKKNKDLFLYVSSDGAQSSDRGTIDDSADGRGKLAWMVDAGTQAASFVLVHRAGNAGRPPILKTSRQYGSFVEGGGVDMRASPVAGLPDRQAAFVFLNYLALYGAEADFGTLLGSANPLPPPLDDHLFFGKMIA
jgi:hypothetical protein